MTKKSENEKEYLLSLLKDPMLWKRLTEDELDERIVGEDLPRKTIFLCAMGGSLVKNCNVTSFNLLVNSSSGAGKDHISNGVLKVLPKDIWIKRTRISPTVLNYWKPFKTWDGKILYLEDCSNNVFNSDVFKVMCSSGSHATITQNGIAFDIEIKGKPVILVTSASANPNAELLRRFAIVNLDESEEQTKNIISRILERCIKANNDIEIADYHKSLEFLTRVEVSIPFSKKLEEHLPAGHIILRTHIHRLVDYIKASAAIHQYQREINSEDESVIATIMDYKIAREVLLATASNNNMLQLTITQKKVLELISKKPRTKTVFEGVEEKEIDLFLSPRDLVSELKISEKQIGRILDKFHEWDLVEKASEKREEKGRPIFVYRYVQQTELTLPKAEDIAE